MIELNLLLICQCFIKFTFNLHLFLQGINFVQWKFLNVHQRRFIQTMPQEIYDDLFYEQAVVDLTEIKQFLKCLQTPYFFPFFDDYDYLKKKKAF